MVTQGGVAPDVLFVGTGGDEVSVGQADDWEWTVATPGEAVERTGEDVDCVVCARAVGLDDWLRVLDVVQSWTPHVPFVLLVDPDSDDVDGDVTGVAGVDAIVVTGDQEELARRVEAVFRRARDVNGATVDYRTVVESSGDLLAVVDDRGTLRYLSPSTERILGYEPGELVGENSFEHVHEDDRDRLIDRFVGLKTSATRTTAELTYRFGHADGSWVWLESVVTNEREAAVDGYVVDSRDVTERKRRQREMELKNRAMEKAPIGITITDPSKPDNPLIYVNDGFVRLTGYGRGDILGRNCRFLQGEETDPGTTDEIRAAIDDKEPVSTDLLNYREDGTPFWNRLTVAPLEDEDGEVTHFVGFQRDVTERKEYEQLIERQLDEFGSILAEDLREPLGRARETLAAARGSDDPDLADVSASLDRLDALIEDLSTVHSRTVTPRELSERTGVGPDG